MIRLKKQINVEPVRKTNVIVVSHEGPRPEVSQQIVSTLIDFYLDEHASLNRTHGARGFMDKQAAALKGQLARLEDNLRDLKNQTGLASPAEQRQIAHCPNWAVGRRMEDDQSNGRGRSGRGP